MNESKHTREDTPPAPSSLISSAGRLLFVLYELHAVTPRNLAAIRQYIMRIAVMLIPGMAAETGIPKATHEGVLHIGDASIPAAVLNTGQRVLTQSGFMQALGRARQAKGRQHYDADVNMPAFLTAKNLKPFISKELEVTSIQTRFT